jgi:hypothetical protein
MHPGEQHPLGADAAGTRATAPSPELVEGWPGEADRAEHREQPARRAIRRPLMALAWIVGGAGLFVLFLRVSLMMGVSSDAANNALQAWDLAHGHLLLHGWLIGDATYWTFDLPVMALVEVVLGLHTISVHVALALIYLIVAVCAVAIAVTGASDTAARLSRAAIVVAILAAPSLLAADRWVTLGLPDHTGTIVFLLVSCLLVDRAPSRRFTAPLLCVILCAGQIADVTVRYVTVPAICVMAAYQILAARKIRTGDTAILLAGIASLPLATVVRALMRHFGSYLMVSPKTTIAPVSLWSHNAKLAWASLRELFGSQVSPGWPPAGAWAIFGSACLAAVAIGFVTAVLRWPRARRAEQVLTVAIIANIGVYVLSTLPGPNTPHDLVGVLPAGAILAARALVPARLAGRLPRLAAAGVAALTVCAALLPLSLIAAKPSATAFSNANQQVADWLTAHGLSYGLSGYWTGPAITLQDSDGVQIRTIIPTGGAARPYPWETNLLWFDPHHYYANFVILQGGDGGTVPTIERIFGRPAYTHTIGAAEILVYRKNLLTEVRRAILKQVS